MSSDIDSMQVRYSQAGAGTPFALALGIETVESGEGSALVRLRYKEDLVGNPDTGVIHGGAITALLDHGAGAAIASAVQGAMMMATLDLRIDYMKPATPGLDVLAHVRCYKRTKNIAFIRGEAFHDSADDPIATCQASFMLTAHSHVPGAAGP